LPLIYTLLILFFFILLLILSKRGFIKIAAWLLVLAYSLPMFYSFIRWGADLPAALLLAVLIVTLSGILIGANLVIISTAAISAFLIVLTYLRANGLVAVNSYWRAEKHELGDALAYAILLIIIALIAWLYARSIHRALQRAQHSEAELKQERDQLEVRVKERTEQLRQSEAEKLNQLYRLAEFGRLSSGIFHDLINPLTAISLNLEQINEKTENKLVNTKSSLDQALLATHKMENLIASIKKQIQLEGGCSLFTLNEEIEQILQILSYKARRAKVQVTFAADDQIQSYGDMIKFGQIISNLLANAIEACETVADQLADPAGHYPEVQITLKQQDGQAVIIVNDQGAGISPDNFTKIFEPFFSTKKEAGRGLGLGLASTKDIIEKCFDGTIAVDSRVGAGSKFTVSLPLNLPSYAD
jgi:signal transduction histidine kinase